MEKTVPKFRFKNFKKVFIIIFIFFSFCLSAQISVNLPTVFTNTNETVSIPISVSNIDTSSIFSFYTEIVYNPDVIEISDVMTDSCITEIWSDPLFNNISEGTIAIGMYGTDSLSADGNLCNLIFDVIVEVDSFSILGFQQFIFNEGEPAADLSDGIIIIINRTPSFIPIDDIFANEEDFINFFVYAEDPFELTLTLEAFDLPDSAEFEDYGDGSGHFQWQTDQISSGEYIVGFTATNEQDFSDTMFVNISVENVLNVRLPEIETAATDSILIPVQTYDVTGLDVYSAYMKIHFTPLVIQPDEIVTISTLTENWGTVTSNLNNPGEIFISIFGTEALTGSGILFNLDFDITGTDGSFSDLSFAYFVYNDGIPEVTLFDGIIYIGTPVAEFSSNQVQGYSPLIIEFYDQSISGPIPITEWEWDFGDGEISYEQNPIHTFYETGSYLISLTVTNENDSTDTEIKSNYITVLPLTADFSASPLTGYHPVFEVDFTDHSPGNITSWNWDFQNDGIDDSFEQNPTFTYTDAGIYDVKLLVSDGTNIDSLIREDYITVLYAPPAAPTNVQIEISNNDAIISWTEVDTTIFGAEIEIDFYIIYGSYDPYADFVFLNTTSDTLFIQNNITLLQDKMFYYVESFLGSRQELDRYIKKKTFIIRLRSVSTEQAGNTE